MSLDDNKICMAANKNVKIFLTKKTFGIAIGAEPHQGSLVYPFTKLFQATTFFKCRTSFIRKHKTLNACA